MASVQLRGVAKSFRGREVLSGLDLELPEGSFTSILGPSGSGKTTLLRVIAGFEHTDAGTVEVGGEVVDDGRVFVGPERRRIGYVVQEGALFPHLTVAANVGFGIARGDDRARRVAGLLEMVDLARLAGRYPHELSGGQQQRVALARALAIEPTLVLMDEPFSSLDASLRASLRADVRAVLRDAGATVLLVTHDQDEALSLADRVAVLRDGRIGQLDPPEAIYRRPESARLAESLGESNFLTGRRRGEVVQTALGDLALDEVPAGASELLVLVRPEQIVASAGGEGPRAKVLEREFYGHDVVLRLRPAFDGGRTLTLRTANVTSSPRVGDEVVLSVRGRVVGWAVEG